MFKISSCFYDNSRFYFVYLMELVWMSQWSKIDQKIFFSTFFLKTTKMSLIVILLVFSKKPLFYYLQMSSNTNSTHCVVLQVLPNKKNCLFVIYKWIFNNNGNTRDNKQISMFANTTERQIIIIIKRWNNFTQRLIWSRPGVSLDMNRTRNCKADATNTKFWNNIKIKCNKYNNHKIDKAYECGFMPRIR